MCTNHKSLQKQSGVTIIELILFMVIIGVALAGILSIMNLTSVSGTDPMRTKQALAIAESLLEEVELQAFTYCDPDDANASTATAAVVGVGGCATTVQGVGKTAGEDRYTEPRFDNVGDYHNFTMNGIVDIQNSVIAGLSAYSATVTETAIAGSGGDQIQIDVLVTSGNINVSLTGMRFRYSPRTVP
jgi:MSHA pilin protein MshD